MFRYKTIPVGVLQVNCYVVWNTDVNEALIIDPGDEPEKIVERIRQVGVTPKGILLTHAHVDHIRGVSGVASAFGIPVWCHAGDRVMYGNPENAILPWIPAAENLPALAAEEPSATGLSYRVLHTPGHTPGGGCYYFEQAKALFSGDTLFQGTYGRTDFPGGNAETLFRSLRETLLVLPHDTTVLPGHGMPTNIAAEQHVI